MEERPDYPTGSSHSECPGDTDICPVNGCKRCQGEIYDNGLRTKQDVKDRRKKTLQARKIKG